jgi:hypothetical protein
LDASARTLGTLTALKAAHIVASSTSGTPRASDLANSSFAAADGLEATASDTDDEDEDDDAIAGLSSDAVASNPQIHRRFTRMFEQLDGAAEPPRFPPCPSLCDSSAAAWADRRRLVFHLFENPNSSTMVPVSL